MNEDHPPFASVVKYLKIIISLYSQDTDIYIPGLGGILLPANKTWPWKLTGFYKMGDFVMNYQPTHHITTYDVMMYDIIDSSRHSLCKQENWFQSKLEGA